MNGEVQIEPSLALRWPGEFQITSAPVIIGDVVITGTSIGDNLRTDAPIGSVHAFHAITGEPLWTFNPIPWGQDGEGKRIGHANVWSTLSVDVERDLVFCRHQPPVPIFTAVTGSGIIATPTLWWPSKALRVSSFGLTKLSIMMCGITIFRPNRVSIKSGGTAKPMTLWCR